MVVVQPLPFSQQWVILSLQKDDEYGCKNAAGVLCKPLLQGVEADTAQAVAKHNGHHPVPAKAFMLGRFSYVSKAGEDYQQNPVAARQQMYAGQCCDG